MIIDFRVVVPRQEYLDQAGAAQVAKLETEVMELALVQAQVAQAEARPGA